jgi:gliding motility-associated-like protein
MNKLLCLVHSLKSCEKNHIESLSTGLYLLLKKSFVLIFLICTGTTIYGQDIPLKNPSLEGIPAEGRVPVSWMKAAGTPDIQPGIHNINVSASDGNTYVGLHAGAQWAEAIAQAAALRGGHTYTVSFDLAYIAHYTYTACYGNLAIYGGNAPGDSAELLWKSGPFYHTSWQQHNAVFSPSHDYKYISFWADGVLACNKSDYGSALLIDNFSPTIREVPQVVISVQSTCKGVNTGMATAKVIGGIPPYTYLWQPGEQTTPHIEQLPAGKYSVTITSANGTSTSAVVIIKETDLKNEVTTVPSPCNGDNQNQILLNTTGGMPPYRYYFNGAATPSYTGVFKELQPGKYKLLVKDEQGCEDKLSDIVLTEPDPLQIAAVNTKDISCDETTDGKIALTIAGGTLPYSYKMESGSWQPDSLWTHLDEGHYYFEIKDHHNCQTHGSAGIIRNHRNCAVYVPTAFSPNSDGLNDLFRARVNDDVSNYKLEVYNRWGALVFRTSDPEGAWDGGQQPIGNYIWVLVYTDSKKQARKQTGYLMLVK